MLGFGAAVLLAVEGLGGVLRSETRPYLFGAFDIWWGALLSLAVGSLAIVIFAYALRRVEFQRLVDRAMRAAADPEGVHEVDD